MKTIIATTALIMSLSAPTFAEVSDARALLALGNDSAAERIAMAGSEGDTSYAKEKLALSNDSAVERIVKGDFATRGDTASARAFFAMGNDSAAEQVVR